MTAWSRARRVLWFWGPAAVYMAVIFVGSSFSRLPDPGVSDKTVHLGEYAVLGLLMVRALGGPGWQRPARSLALAAVLACAVYAASDEVHQLFVVGRQGDVLDVAADVCGAGASVGLLWAWNRIRRYRE